MIRSAKLADIEQIMQLTAACTADMTAQGIYQWNEHYPNVEAFEIDIANNELWVLEDKQTLIGIVAICSEMDPEYKDINWLSADLENYYVHRLAVHPDYQHQGYARKLMDFVEHWAKEHKANSIRLDTFSQNPRNQKFYENRGYQKLGSIYLPQQSEHPFYCYELLLKEPIGSTD